MASSTIKDALLNCFNKLQPKNTKLTNISGLTTPANKLPLCLNTSGQVVAKSLTYNDVGAAKAEHYHEQYLQTSGGTMTGTLFISAASPIITKGTVGIKGQDDTSQVNIQAGTQPSSGAYLELYGKDHATYPSSFRLIARSGTTYKILKGDLNGKLNWNGEDVVTKSSDGTITVNKVASSVDNSSVVVSGGNTSGATLTLYGNNNTSAPGKFVIATSNGSSLIGNASDSSLTWNGSFIEADVINNTSDRNLKENISEVSFDLSKIKAYKYNFKNDDKKIVHVGLIAQEIKDVIPEAVSVNTSGNLMLDYNAVVAALVDEVNKLKEEIKKLKEK